MKLRKMSENTEGGNYRHLGNFILSTRNLNVRFMLLCLLCFSFSSLKAHESRPVFIQIKQINPNFIKINYSIPNTVDYRNLPYLQLGTSFIKDSSAQQVKTDAQAYLVEEVYKGKIQDLRGQTIAWIFPYFNPILSTVVEIYFEPDKAEIHVLSPKDTVLDLAEKPKNTLQSTAFIGLGIEHIFKGIDHLLFVVCLLIITGITRQLFWTITGFTVAHSITLFLSVLGFVNIPVPFVEVCIALSIIFLCCEIVHQCQGENSLTYRYPFLISASFGLLHGLGFAAVLIEIGLPKNSLISSLLFFNVGVELGQLLFISSLILFFFMLKKAIINRFLIKEKYPVIALKAVTYIIGTVASFWFFERISAWY
jgi:hydrogenase/urease accessory protein HupE